MAEKTDPRVVVHELPYLGSICPDCGTGTLDFNGLLELECPRCGYRNTDGAIGT